MTFDLRASLRFAPHDGGVSLLPVVAQDHLTGEVRMLAWASPEAVERTLATGKATFWSRSRRELWTKGETSGNVLAVRSVLVDCDEDALIYVVRAAGPTCHTGAATCFFRRLGPKGVSDEEVSATTALARLDAVLEARRAATAAKSYTKSLYDGGAAKIGAKLREEADELASAVEAESDDRVVSEAADVLFHAMVALRSRGLGVEAVLAELERRAGTSGHDEKSSRFLGDTPRRP
ncbi:MAG: bifunctional phosphoribosyl-AMP cyclohydrolase/phosphoribosyl-ATP diphosphatase HisIE [Labilithrix sp.]|nr:bifunctional phosphoribosyl-AMP cyclohydrolase/phosphoribosyl-ATP diphosphatase HisIE [Labilithrix sp.]MCW5810548.1 bifunctional phosphoribosyl-AMP cyclohydrolase/phosphoribosyl-ATP diphosphatase HisIE [Labilithrix sp.]